MNKLIYIKSICRGYAKTNALPLIASLLFVLLVGCDQEKFTGFSYDAQILAETAPISGKISNIFTGEPVKAAQIYFENQFTESNGLGEYNLDFFIDDDHRANRSVPINLTAPGYYPLESSIIVFPDANTANFEMVYGAPIVLSAWFTPDTAAYGIIFDYQGYDNLDSVFVLTLHEPTDSGNTGILYWIETQMVPVRQIDDNSGEFMAHLPVDAGRIILNRIRFRIKDHDNFQEETLLIF